MNDIEDLTRYTAPPEPPEEGRDEMDIAHEWQEQQDIEAHETQGDNQ